MSGKFASAAAAAAADAAAASEACGHEQPIFLDGGGPSIHEEVAQALPSGGTRQWRGGGAPPATCILVKRGQRLRTG